MSRGTSFGSFGGNATVARAARRSTSRDAGTTKAANGVGADGQVLQEPLDALRVETLPTRTVGGRPTALQESLDALRVETSAKTTGGEVDGVLQELLDALRVETRTTTITHHAFWQELHAWQELLDAL